MFLLIVATVLAIASVLACLLTKPGKQDVPDTLADDGNPNFPEE